MKELKNAIYADNHLENSANFFLTPLRILFRGRSFSYYKGSFIERTHSKTTTWKVIETVLALLLFIPGTFLGMACKASALLLSKQVQKRFEICNRLQERLPFFENDGAFHLLDEQIKKNETELLSENEPSNVLMFIETEINKHVESYISDKSSFTKNIGCRENNLAKNRWPKLPYDYNCPKNYVNASKVALGGLSFLPMQGPLHSTIEDTLNLCIEDKVETIVSLCMHKEKGLEKCHDFWNGVEIETKQLKLTPLKEKVIFSEDEQRLLKRKFLLTSGVYSKRIVQFHYENWPDHSIPNKKTFKAIINAVEKRMEKRPGTTLSAHCSAGIGRTGTFIASYALHILRRAWKEKKINSPPSIASLVFRLKLQRGGSIENMTQLNFIYELFPLLHAN